MQADVWAGREGVARLTDDMVGYNVEARDGRIGKIDRVSYTGNCLFVSTGRLMKHRHAIPAGTVERVDAEHESVFVDATREEVEKAPTYNGQRGFDEDCERTIGAYYGDLLAKRSAAG